MIIKYSAMSLEEAKKVFGLTSWPVEESELKKQYRLLALQHHTDRGGSEEAIKQVNLAAEVLFDELEKAGKSEKGTFSKLHADVDKAMADYKHISHKDAGDAEEIMAMEETHKTLKEKGHIDLAKLDAQGNARIKMTMKSGAVVQIKVWKDKTSRTPKYYAEVESVSGTSNEHTAELQKKFPPGTRLSDAEARKYYDRAEAFRNYENRIRDKKKSLSRQKAYSETFEIKEHGLGGTAYYTTEPSESIASDLIGYLLKTNVLKKLTKGKDAGALKVDAAAIHDLSKSKDMNAKFIAGVDMYMRGFVDKGVTSNSMAQMDARTAAEEIAAYLVFGSPNGPKEYEKDKKLDSVPYKEKNLKEHEGKTAEQVEKDEYDKEYKEVLSRHMEDVKSRIDQLKRSTNTQFRFDKNTSMPRAQRIENEEKIMTDQAQKIAEGNAKRHSEYAKKNFEESKEHREKGVYRYNDQGQHSDVFKKEHGEYLDKKSNVEKQAKEITARMADYARNISKVMVDKKLMEPHPDMKYRTQSFVIKMKKYGVLKNIVELANSLDKIGLYREADQIDRLLSK